jgi:DNA-binding transcriptional LysR family regulator
MVWDDVRMLLVLLEVQNLHETGKRLGVDRSTVSRRLTALEHQLGTPLFTRTRDGLRPTAAIERVRPFAEAMASDAKGLERAARSAEVQATGRVRVATTEAIAVLLVERGLLATAERHPGLLIELTSGNAPVDLLHGDADLAVRVSPLRHASLRARRVAKLKIGLFASPSYLQRRGRPQTTAALRAHDVILPSAELARLPEARWLEARPNVRVAFRSNSLPALLSAAAAGLGIVPVAAAWGDLDRRLQRIQVLDDVPARTIWLVAPPMASTRAAIRVVADRIVEVFARLVRPESAILERL